MKCPALFVSSSASLQEARQVVPYDDLIPLFAIQTRIQRISHSISQQIESQHGDHDGNSGEENQMRRCE